MHTQTCILLTSTHTSSHTWVWNVSLFLSPFFTDLHARTSEHAPPSLLGSFARPPGFRPPVQILALQPLTKAPFEKESCRPRILMKILFSQARVGQTCAFHGRKGNNAPTGMSALEWWWSGGSDRRETTRLREAAQGENTPTKMNYSNPGIIIDTSVV